VGIGDSANCSERISRLEILSSQDDGYLFRFDLVISFFNAAPSSGLSSSNEHSRSSETDMTAPKFYGTINVSDLR